MKFIIAAMLVGVLASCTQSIPANRSLNNMANMPRLADQIERQGEFSQ